MDVVLWIAVIAGPPSPTPQAEWLAASDLAANTRLTESHLVKPAFPNPWSAQRLPKITALKDKYLRVSRRRGEAIEESKLSGAPTIAEHKDEAILFLPAKDLGAAAGRLNAGAKVYLCEEGKPCPNQPLYVEAVLGDGTSAQVAVRVRQQDISILRGITKPVLVLASIPP